MRELEELRRAILESEDQAYGDVVEQKGSLAEKDELAHAIGILEADLKRVRRDAEAFGRDLRHLKEEKEAMIEVHAEDMAKAQRARKQAQTQIRVLYEQLEEQKEKLVRIKAEFQNHVCEG